MPTPADAAFQALVAQGNRARFSGDAEAAEGAYRRPLAMRPGNAPVQANLGLLLLSVGRYAQGWPLYEARRVLGGRTYRRRPARRCGKASRWPARAC
jgi:hypothetical protein